MHPRSSGHRFGHSFARTEYEQTFANVTKIAEFSRIVRLRASFGTRGSQVQILPLRPRFRALRMLTGPDMGNETHILWLFGIIHSDSCAPAVERRPIMMPCASSNAERGHCSRTRLRYWRPQSGAHAKHAADRIKPEDARRGVLDSSMTPRSVAGAISDVVPSWLRPAAPPLPMYLTARPNARCLCAGASRGYPHQRVRGRLLIASTHWLPPTCPQRQTFPPGVVPRSMRQRRALAMMTTRIWSQPVRP
jgi:hypothetical protein